MIVVNGKYKIDEHGTLVEDGKVMSCMSSNVAGEAVLTCSRQCPKLVMGSAITNLFIVPTDVPGSAVAVVMCGCEPIIYVGVR